MNYTNGDANLGGGRVVVDRVCRVECRFVRESEKVLVGRGCWWREEGGRGGGTNE
jgi:hypothetical protein